MPTTNEKGYGADHRKLRTKYQKRMDAGEVFHCPRCTRIIVGEWDLGHDDNDRSIWTGPEHIPCNRATQRHKAAKVVDTSRLW